MRLCISLFALALMAGSRHAGAQAPGHDVYFGRDVLAAALDGLVGERLSAVRYVAYFEDPWDLGPVHRATAVELVTASGRVFTFDNPSPHPDDQLIGWVIGAPCRRPDVPTLTLYEGRRCSTFVPGGATSQAAYEARLAEVLHKVGATALWSPLVGREVTGGEAYWSAPSAVYELSNAGVVGQPGRYVLALRLDVGGRSVYLSGATPPLHAMTGRAGHRVGLDQTVYVTTEPEAYGVGQADER